MVYIYGILVIHSRTTVPARDVLEVGGVCMCMVLSQQFGKAGGVVGHGGSESKRTRGALCGVGRVRAVGEGF